MKKIKLLTFAKVNLSLNIVKLGKMHTLDSVMRSVDLADAITVEIVNTSVEKPRANIEFVNASVPSENTVKKAFDLLCPYLPPVELKITIEKNIPIGGGLGGSSADAAGLIRALDRIFMLTERGANLRNIALEVGSDVPFMLTGGCARVRGMGEDLYCFKDASTYFAVVISAGSVSTRDAYNAFDTLIAKPYSPTDNDLLVEKLLDGNFTESANLFANALTAPARSLNPQIDVCLNKLKNYTDYVIMTGSGGCCLGFFSDLNQAANCRNALKKENAFLVSPVPHGSIIID